MTVETLNLNLNLGGGYQASVAPHHAPVPRSNALVHLACRDLRQNPRGKKMLYSGTDPESYITEYTLAYEEKPHPKLPPPPIRGLAGGPSSAPVLTAAERKENNLNDFLIKMKMFISPATSPQSRIKPPFSILLVCTGARRNLATCSALHGSQKRRFAPGGADTCVRNRLF